MNLAQRETFFRQLKTNNSHPETDLEYSSPFFKKKLFAYYFEEVFF